MKTEGYKDYSKKAKLKVFKRKPSVLFSKKSKQKENRTEGNKGTRDKFVFPSVLRLKLKVFLGLRKPSVFKKTGGNTNC